METNAVGKTKTCKYCKSEIAEWASICPNCKKDLRNFFVRHPIITLILILLVIGKIGQLSIDNPSGWNMENLSTNSIPQTTASKTIRKVELPPEKTCASNLGILKMDINGHSIGAKTEMTELLRLLKSKDCDIIEITYQWRSSGYDDMPKKIVYNRRSWRLQDIYTKTNVIEDYKGVSPEGLQKFLIKWEKDFLSLSEYTDMTYDFNNREMKPTAIWPQPSQSELDGSVKVVKDYIDSRAKDSSSIEYLEWSKVSSFGDSWIVRCKYKGTNSFGGVVTENKWFYIQNNAVVNTKDITE